MAGTSDVIAEDFEGALGRVQPVDDVEANLVWVKRNPVALALLMQILLRAMEVAQDRCSRVVSAILLGRVLVVSMTQ